MPNPQNQPSSIELSVLVVEDVLVRLLICDALRDAGVRVIEAANADEGLLYLKSDPSVGLVFSDVRMPGSMDGVNLARRVKTEFPGIQVILASGHLLASDVAVDVPLLSKPYPLEATVTQIVDLLDQQRQR
jgi:two-component system, response regulator PdtaR